MNHHPTIHATMNKENRSSEVIGPTVRVTRARAKAFGSSGGLPPSYPSTKQDGKRVLQTNSKRAASDENKPGASSSAFSQHKKRAVLKEVTNILCENSYRNCINATKVQLSKLDRRGTARKNARVAHAVSFKESQVPEDRRENITEEINAVQVEESQDNCFPVNFKELVTVQPSEFVSSTEKQNSRESRFWSKQENMDNVGIMDIDSKHKDPLMCSMYAPDIYRNLHATEFDWRPSGNYMEKLQQDINPGMRGILIDWLVEVSEEYRLVPDTLYLTVNLLDRFLSENYIEKQKLQLLGVTCMLIASKYEEICAPRVEEFCFITDNTYTKEEVVKMESRVLNFLGFQLSVPTTKKFLRRFIQAAQVSYEVPSVELEFLANYLAELTLTEYSLLEFLPSLVAASAVFLARWTLDQSDHPWNSTLEHYTNYKASEMKITVLVLQDLQLNTHGCKLPAIREKYKQSKFKCVSTLSSPKPVQSLF
ncbi:cyclin-A2-1-like [Olea europaea var. sylvestris]|uniref:Cyclin-A2-2-like n=1 Tax=Olea europaea subsp. europaea TaxID=158383 RepID=A0A8S0U618_OLEEU|nr:cyclin-A2-1-like [Olea europaea var. sylvestris]CAA3014264.1 cyclin-A2-2-like [Olea europaea subsp. europaea]